MSGRKLTRHLKTIAIWVVVAGILIEGITAALA